MIEFCENCGGIMLPSEEEGKKFLLCNLCKHTKQLTEDLINSYKINKEIFHPPGEEFKNLEKMKNWEEKEIYNKF